MRDVFVVAGDAEEPRGSFHGAIDLLEALDELGRPFPEVGITGYPESHPFIDDETTDRCDGREGPARDLHREPGLLRPEQSPRSGSRTSGRAGSGFRSTSAFPVW